MNEIVYSTIKRNYTALDIEALEIIAEAYRISQEKKLYTEEEVKTAIELAKEGNIGYYAPDCPAYYFDNSEESILKTLNENK